MFSHTKWRQIILVFQLCVNLVRTADLHRFMDDKELIFYFGTSDRLNLPHYEVENVVMQSRNAYDRWLDMDYGKRPIETEFLLKFNVVNQPISLDMQINRNLASPMMQIKRTSGEQISEMNHRAYAKDCHYAHTSAEVSAALSNCQGSGDFDGIILFADATYELRSLKNRLKSFVKLQAANRSISGEGIAHILKKVSVPSGFGDDAIGRTKINRNDFLKEFPGEPDSWLFDKRPLIDGVPENSNDFNKIKRSTKERKLTVETAVFFDAAAYKLFAPYYKYNDSQLQDMILAYMNGVQSLYHHSSLGTPVDLTIVYMEIMQTQPLAMPHYQGERGPLLDSFCAYQKSINPTGDTNPHHWDMALYISGLDFFAYENGRRSTGTMGLATVGGVCIAEYACIIAEFGTTNAFGKPYPSAGFTSVYILAHEIGHNLGMHHDSFGNDCPSEGFVMSPTRGTLGETTWSSCSADAVRELTWADCLNDKPPSTPAEYNAWKYEGFPGQTMTTKKQCELLLKDKDAVAAPTGSLEIICQNLECRTPHRSGYYFSGPALAGTDCAPGKWCDGGDCVKKSLLLRPIKVVKGGWSSWQSKPCASGCLVQARGWQQRERICNNPKPVNSDEGCDGAAFSSVTCNDDRICRKTKRSTAVEYATSKCHEFSEHVPQLDSVGIGLQATHETNRLWMACAIFCKRKNSTAYYTPRLDLNDLGIDPYFPDGTWCHNDDRQNYYCLQHHCLPENFQITKYGLWQLSEDVPIPGNAQPNTVRLNEKLVEYLSIDETGKALRSQLFEDDLPTTKHDSEWTHHDDYLELPDELKLKFGRLRLFM